MTEVVLNGSEITSKDELHDLLARELAFPEWYGRNLDALYDCLTDRTEDAAITLLEAHALEEHLGRYARSFIRTLKDIAAENPHIHADIQ